MRPGLGCDILPKDALGKIFKSGDKFIDSPEVKNKINDPSRFAEEVYYQVFRVPFKYRDDISYSKGEVKIFENRLNEIRRSINTGKFHGRVGEFMFTTAWRAKKNPMTAKLLNEIVDAGYYFKGNQERHNREFGNVLSFLKKHNNASYFFKNIGGNQQGKRWNAAVKQANDYDKQMEELGRLAEEGDTQAAQKFTKLRNTEEGWYQKGEGKIFTEFLDHVEKDIPKVWDNLQKEYYNEMWTEVNNMRSKGRGQDSIDMYIRSYENKNKVTYDKIFNKLDKNNKPIIGFKSEHMANALKEYVKLMEGMHHTLVKGVNSYVDAITEANKTLKSPQDLSGLRESLLEKITPDQKIGFYPHYRRYLGIDFMSNLMPHMEKVSDSLTESLVHNEQGIQKAIDGMSSYLSGHVKQRAPGVNEPGNQVEYSRNFVANIKRYVDEVDRFNFMAHIDNTSRKSLNEARKQFKDGSLDGYASDTVKLLYEMNQAAKGKNLGFENKNHEAIARSLLGFEFVSKLGFNLRSGLRNGTQTLLNAVEFGPVMWHNTNKFYKEMGVEFTAKVEKILDDSGLKFVQLAPELQEISGKLVPESKTKFNLDPDGRLSDNEGSALSRLEGTVNWVAGKSGVIMRKVENWNREKTFKIGFAKMYQELDASTSLKTRLRKEGKSEDQIQNEIMTLSRRYAINMTTALHFDYSGVSKSKALRHPLGRFFGQFQHYGFKFFEYNAGLIKDAAADVATGETLLEKFYGPSSAKAMRMALAYYMVPAFAAHFTGMDIFNLVQHDSVERIQKIGAAFMAAGDQLGLIEADDEELNKLFYGSGPIVGNLGAPLLSDMLQIGHINEWWQMEEEGLASLVTGYENYANVTGDRKFYETVRILNTQLGRTAYHTWPLLFSSPGTALQFEAGMYPSKKVRDKTARVKAELNRFIPDPMRDALDALEGVGSAAELHRKRAIHPSNKAYRRNPKTGKLEEVKKRSVL